MVPYKFAIVDLKQSFLKFTSKMLKILLWLLHMNFSHFSKPFCGFSLFMGRFSDPDQYKEI